MQNQHPANRFIRDDAQTFIKNFLVESQLQIHLIRSLRNSFTRHYILILIMCFPRLVVCLAFLRPVRNALKRAHGRLICVGVSRFESPELEWDHWDDVPVKYHPLNKDNVFEGPEDDDVQILFQRPRLRIRSVESSNTSTASLYD